MNISLKTGNWISNHIKKGKNPNSGDGKLDNSLIKETEVSSAMKYFTCSYCSKIFINAKYLVKHIIKRHSDELLLIHKKYSTDANKTNVGESPLDVITVLKAGFADLKGELESVIKTVNDDHKLLTAIDSKLLKDSFPIVSSPYDHEQGYQNSKTECKDQKEISPSDVLQNLKAQVDELFQCQNSKHECKNLNEKTSLADFQNLQAQVDELFQRINSVATKHDIQELCAINEKRVYQQVRDNLFIELQSIFITQQENNNALCKSYFSELKRDLRNLEIEVKNNTDKINSPQYILEIQKQFEEKIKHILISPSMFEGNVKNKQSQIKNASRSNKPSESLSRANRRKRSIYTNAFPSVATECKTILKTANEKSECEKSPVKLVELSDNATKDFDAYSKTSIHNAKTMLNEKLKTLNIPPGTKKLSAIEYEKKLRLLRSEKNLLSKKYRNFSHVYSSIDSYADKLVKTKLNGKMERKLRFSSPPCEPTVSGKSYDSENSLQKIQDTVSQKEQNETFFKFQKNTIRAGAGDGFYVPHIYDMSNTAALLKQGGQYEKIPSEGYNVNKLQDITRNTQLEKGSSRSFMNCNVEALSEMSSLESDDDQN